MISEWDNLLTELSLVKMVKKKWMVKLSQIMKHFTFYRIYPLT